MRIGITSTTIESSINRGIVDGIGTYTLNLFNALRKQNQHVTPYSFPNAKRPVQSSYSNGCFFPYNYSLSTIFSFLNTHSIYTQIGKHIDLLHVTDHMLPKLKNIPVIATIHDGIMFNPQNWHWDSIRLGNFKKWLRKKTLHWASQYITVSYAMVSELVQYIGIKEEKISVVYSGIDPWWHEMVPDNQKESTLLRLKLPKQFFLAAGTIQHKKNLPRLIEAYLALPKDIQESYPLIIVGRVGWGVKESMRAIGDLINSKKGVWLDYISQDDLKVLYQCAALYLHPSLHEGFGLTILEAFASKTPVITSNVTALPEIANGAAYLVNPYSVVDITQAIQNVITSKTMQDELTQKGIARAHEFSWDKCALDTLKIYQSVL